MCCCAMELSRRQWLVTGLLASASMLVTSLTDSAGDSADAQAVLRNTITVDIHSHAAGQILRGSPDASLAEGMKKGLRDLPGPCARRAGSGAETVGRACGRTRAGGWGVVSLSSGTPGLGG
jgi:hypothetical protein